MNAQLKDINEIIVLCDSMIAQIRDNGVLYSRNQTYEEYKAKIELFLKSNNLIRNDFGPFQVLKALYYSTTGYSVNLSEAMSIRNTVISLKHELFPNAFERIFISHREKDKAQVAAFMELLYSLGIPRPTIGNDEKVIFCTSHPTAYIENGARNLDEIRAYFSSPDHTFFILWYSDNYFESQACLNEAGAIWAMNKNYQEILMPNFDSAKIGGLMDKQRVWFRANDKARLNTLKAQLETMFGLDPLTFNAWETARDTFIAKIEALSQ